MNLAFFGNVTLKHVTLLIYDAPVIFLNQLSELSIGCVFGFPARRSKPKDMWQRIFLAFLLSILFLDGVAWAQRRNDLEDQGQYQLLQTDMVDKDQTRPNLLSIDKPNAKANSKNAARVTDIKKNIKSSSPKPKSFGSSSRQYGMSDVKSKESGLIGTGDNQSGGVGSKSFLDGYLLKSLHDGYISGKKPSNEEKPGKEEKPKDDLRLRGKTSL